MKVKSQRGEGDCGMKVVYVLIPKSKLVCVHTYQSRVGCQHATLLTQTPWPVDTP